jgi:hypothetical protein
MERLMLWRYRKIGIYAWGPGSGRRARGTRYISLWICRRRVFPARQGNCGFCSYGGDRVVFTPPDFAMPVRVLC